jgi:hypothetical protein
VITRRNFILAGLAVPASAYSSKAFWNDRKPAEWTAEEVRLMLNKSPWAKDASLTYYGGQNGPLASGSARTGRRGGGQIGRGDTNPTPSGQWKAVVRWESALPVREALKLKSLDGLAENYILNMFGDVPSMGTALDEDDAQRRQRLDAFKDNTKLEHRGDQINLNRMELAPKSSLSPAGTLFYFSRQLALRLEDKQVTFSTKMGPLEVKCKFALAEMMYQGKLEV